MYDKTIIVRELDTIHIIIESWLDEKRKYKAEPYDCRL